MHVNIGDRVTVNPDIEGVYAWPSMTWTVVGVSRGETNPMVMIATGLRRVILRGSDALYGVEPA